MQSVTTLFNTIFNSNHRVETKISIERSGQSALEFNENAILSLKTTKCLYAEDTLSFGGCVAKELDLEFYPGNSVIPRMAKITVYIRVTNSTSNSEWIQKGSYFIDTRSYDTESGVMSIVAFDAMLKTEQLMIPSGSVPTGYPKLMSAAVSEIATAIGVQTDNRNSFENWQIQVPTGMTMREVLNYIAAVHSGNWTITDDNKLRLIRAITNVNTVSVGQSVMDFSKDDVFSAVTHVIINIDEETFVEAVATTDNGRTIEVTCPWGTQTMANKMLSDLSNFVYQPFTANGAVIHPAVEVGDKLTVNGYTVFLISESTDYSALFTTSVSAPGEAVVDHEYPYQSGITSKIERKLTTATTELWVNMNGISARVDNAESNITQLEITTSGIETRVDGLEEISVSTVEVQYALSDSSQIAPTSGWSAVAPTWQSGKYMWQRTVTTYSDGHSTISDATCIQGAKGADGTDGVGISSVITEYYLSTSSTRQRGGSWSTTAPTWESGKYIWTRSHITWDDGTTSYTTPQLDNTSNDFGNKYSTVKQTADKIEWLVASGSTASNFTITDRLISLVSAGIDITGYVRFNDLSQAGSTTINGSNITTGTINAIDIWGSKFGVQIASNEYAYIQMLKGTGYFGLLFHVNGVRYGHISVSGAGFANPTFYMSHMDSPSKNQLGFQADKVTLGTSDDAVQINAANYGVYIAGTERLAVYNDASGLFKMTGESVQLYANRSAQNYGLWISPGSVRPPVVYSASAPNYLGNNTYKWAAVYAVTGTIQTSDRTEKKNIDYDVSKYLDFFDDLKPVSYQFIEGTSGRTHIGFISQDIEDSLEKVGLSAFDFAGFCKDRVNGKDLYSLRYDEFIALNTMAIKRLEAKLNDLIEEVRGA